MTSVAAAVHEHEWVLRAVDHESGVAVDELCCPACGEVTFR